MGPLPSVTPRSKRRRRWLRPLLLPLLLASLSLQAGDSRPQPRPRPLVFISHSARDHRHASTIATTLRSLGCQVWLDTDHIPPGAHVDLSIQAGLDTATHLLVLIGSPCRTCMAEWIYILDHRPQVPVVPLILPNSPGRMPWRLSPYRRLTSSTPKSLSRLCHPSPSLQ